jgi:hypothetical protein
MPDFAHGGIDSVLGIEKNILPPNVRDDFLTRHQLAPSFDKQAEEFERDALQVHTPAGSAEFKGTPVKLEFAESEEFARHLGRPAPGAPLYSRPAG